jgi:hypothetical protein
LKTMVLSLVDALESFNRKERNLLVRYALAESDPPPLSPPPLGKSFCEKVGGEIGASIPNNAWWATDYHIDWLAGALALFVQGDTAEKQKNNGEVAGNQEDVDLLIAFDRTLIFIEAKGHSSFGNEQLQSKIKHLNSFYSFYERIAGGQQRAIEFHFLLISPKEPKKLEINWPDWTCNRGRVPWIELKVDRGARRVVRCDQEGVEGKHGYWKVRNFYLFDGER